MAAVLLPGSRPRARVVSENRGGSEIEVCDRALIAWA
jgi:hypothetical protein